MITIYALDDPRNAEVRYIGQAAQAERRYAQHLAGWRTGVTLKDCWVRRLYALGLRPQLRLLETVPPAIAYQRECFWMQWYQTQGHDVLNLRGMPHRIGCPLFERIAALEHEVVTPGELVGQRPTTAALYVAAAPPPAPDPVAVLPQFIDTSVQVLPGAVTPRPQMYAAYVGWWWDVPAIGKKLTRPQFEAALAPLLAEQGVVLGRLRWAGIWVGGYREQHAE